MKKDRTTHTHPAFEVQSRRWNSGVDSLERSMADLMIPSWIRVQNIGKTWFTQVAHLHGCSSEVPLNTLPPGGPSRWLKHFPGR